MMKNCKVLSVCVPNETLSQVDALLTTERAALPASARLTRHAMLQNLIALGVKARREQIADERRENDLHTERRAARQELRNVQ